MEAIIVLDFLVVVNQFCNLYESIMSLISLQKFVLALRETGPTGTSTSNLIEISNMKVW